jgi:predicted transcriptional regulator
MAPASLDGYARLLPDLQRRELIVLLSLCEARTDCTGGELAARLDWTVVQVRPRLSSLHDKGLVERGPVRVSRVAGEMASHGYTATVPRAAVMRALEALKSKAKTGTKDA